MAAPLDPTALSWGPVFVSWAGAAVSTIVAIGAVGITVRANQRNRNSRRKTRRMAIEQAISQARQPLIFLHKRAPTEMSAHMCPSFMRYLDGAGSVLAVAVSGDLADDDLITVATGVKAVVDGLQDALLLVEEDDVDVAAFFTKYGGWEGALDQWEANLQMVK
jgi:hypothetical protein